MGRVYQRKRDKGRPGHGSKLTAWYAQWTDENGRRLKRRAGETRREAKEFLAEREAEVARRKRAPGWERTAGAVTLGAFAEDYLAKMVRGRLKDAKARERQLKAWERHLGADTELRKISPASVEGFLARLRSGEDARKPSTCNRYLAAIRHALNAAVDWGYLPASPVARVKQRPENNERTRVISPEEEAKLLEAAKGSRCKGLGPAIVLALETCARPEELMALRWSDVDLDRELVTFRKTKAKRTRQVPLTARALAALEELGTRFAKGWLFLHDGERWVDPRRAFAHACGSAGLPYGRDVEGGLVFRDTRRTAITRLAERGVPAAVIQRWSGHKTLAMVQWYTAVSDEAVRAVADALNRERSQSGPTGSEASSDRLDLTGGTPSED